MRGYSAIIVAGLTLVPALAAAEGEAVNGFPNWSERVMHEWTNRARCDPAVEMQTCGAACPDGASGTCYTPAAPLPWNESLNRAARYHSDEMAAQSFFAHDSKCNLVDNIATIYPGTCQGASACACETGTATAWNARISLFNANAAGEIIASGGDPNGAFYQWLYESYNKSTCGYDGGSPTNGHRWNILKSGPTVGYGHGSGASVGDFGNAGTASTYKIPSGSHYPRQSASVEAWANWFDTAGPKSAFVNVDGTCTAMTLERGSVMNGAYKATLTNVVSGCHRYFFQFKDSADNVITYPTTGSLGIGPDGSCADWDTSRATTADGCDALPPGGGGGDAGTGGDGDGGLDSGSSDGGGCCETGGGHGIATMWLAGIVAVLLSRRQRRC